MGDGCRAGIASVLLLTEMSVPFLRMKAHPDRDFFFLENVERHENASNHLAQNLRPGIAHVGKLAFERFRGSQSRGPQKIDKILVLRPKSRPRLEVIFQRRSDLAISGRLL